MTRQRAHWLTVSALAATLSGGCASVPRPETVRGKAPTVVLQSCQDTEVKAPNENVKNAKDESERPPKALFEWTIGPKSEKNDDEEHQDSIVTDRPDFTEASTTVGRGRVQLEAGYTYFRDRSGGSTQIGE